MIAYIDNLLNRITMYRLVLYYLLVLIAAAALFGQIGMLSYSPEMVLFSAAFITAVCWITNTLFARVFKAATNVESVYITALILALIISPVLPADVGGILFLAWASIWAMASKYIFALRKKHLFNPAALAVVITAFGIGQSATWWVGNVPLLPFVFVGGLLIVRKIQRFDMVLSFGAAALLTTLLTAGGDPLQSLSQTLLHSSFFFLGFVMLTEPLSTPPQRSWRIVYGLIVGFLFAPAVHVGSLFSTPEIALIIGNIFAYIVSPKGTLVLTLKAIEKAGTNMYNFIFIPDKPLTFRPGQYLEWTLPHKKSDTRGNRRYFTIASSPSEREIILGVKFYESSSSFKKALASLKPGDSIAASQLAGEFTLPKNPKQKLAFIAGGIGITPFRSMMQYLIDKKESRDITLFYSNKTVQEVAYKNIFDKAYQILGIKTTYAITDEQTAPPFYQGMITAELIKKETPDYRERTFYLSGPRSMVEAFEKTLLTMGISRLNIKTDFFPGFV